ncbi:MAG TPA: Ppx/GppA phosphatase family protein [Pirellulaceae bacterium]
MSTRLDRSGPHPSGRLAAIDIGSNSVRLVVAEPLHGEQFRILDEERHCTRLAQSLGSSGKLDPEAIEQTVMVLRHFRQLAEGLQVARLETIATCAVREATNAREFLRRVERDVGLKVRVISGRKEALLAFRSVQAAFDLSDQNVAVVDIGGGSTEIVLASSGHVEKTYSTNLGAVRMTELYGPTRQLFDSDHDQLLESIAHEVRRQIRRRPFVPQVLYGTGGTFTSLASMLIARRKEDPGAAWGYRATHADVRHLLERVRRLSPKERRNLPGLGADRADIIVAGLAIIDQIMVQLRTNVLRVHTGGVRDGLLLSMLDASEPIPAAKRKQRASIEQFAVSCGTDLVHARHVANLATRLFDGMRRSFEFEEGDRRLLEVAALLQDVGYLINYRAHHKHSYQLILNSRLPGLRNQELPLIANIARYHRGSQPKKKHGNFRHLLKRDQDRVRRLAALLRIAGGLERGYAQRVKSIRVEVLPERITLHVQASEEPELELWAARGRGEMFENVFGVSLAVAWDGATAPAPVPQEPATPPRAKAKPTRRARPVASE